MTDLCDKSRLATPNSSDQLSTGFIMYLWLDKLIKSKDLDEGSFIFTASRRGVILHFMHVMTKPGGCWAHKVHTWMMTERQIINQSFFDSPLVPNVIYSVVHCEKADQPGTHWSVSLHLENMNKCAIKLLENN